MLRIRSIDRTDRGLWVEYSIDFGATPADECEWCVTFLPFKLNLIEVDWVLRNEWSKRRQ